MPKVIADSEPLGQNYRSYSVVIIGLSRTI